MAGMMSVNGLVSGLQTDDIISKIMSYARRPQKQLESQKAQYQERLAAWQDLNTRILAVKTRVAAIADASDFSIATASSSNSDILTASASNTAATGTYYVTVVSRAVNHQVSSQGGVYTNLNDVVGTGDVNITLNNGTSLKVTLDSSNNTLAGLKDAINKAGSGVQATIVNSGTETAPDYRLLLTSTQGGETNKMVSVTTTLSGGVAPVFDLDNPVQAAAPAQIELGTGAGKITVYKDSNNISDLIPGVTLNLLGADAGTAIRIDVAKDTATIKEAIQDFVAQYNDLADAIDDQFDYDPDSGFTGALFGDSRLRGVQSEIISGLTNPVIGLTGSYNALGAIGITQDFGGHLVVNETDLDKALSSNPQQVMRVFSAGIDSGSAHVTYLSSTADTKPSGTAWEVAITQAAQRAQLTAGSAMDANLAQDETLTVNGTTITLTQNMTLQEVVDRINSYSNTTSVTALATGADGTGTGNYLTFRQTGFGSKRNVEVASNLSYTIAGTTGVGNVKACTVEGAWAGESGLGQGLLGLDVAGTINGVEATGNGQMLTLSGDEVSNSAKGLSLLITSPSPMTATLTYTKGAAATLRDLIDNLTSTNGSITTAEKSLTDAIDDVDESIADMEERLALQEARLYSQFNTMESQLAKLQDQGNYLAAQLSALNSNSK